MSIYLVLIVISLAGAFVSYCTEINEKTKKCLLVALIMVLTVISAFRFEVGADYQHFINEFNSINKYGIESTYTEQGFALMSFLLGGMGFHAQSIYVIGAVLLGFSFYRIAVECIDSKYWGLAVFLFICLGFFFSSMNISRQYYAISLSTLGLVEYCRKDKRGVVSFCFWVFIAAGFHTSSLIMLAVPFLDIISKRTDCIRVLYVIYLISTIFIIVDIREILLRILPLIDRWSGYSDSEFFNVRNYSALFKLVIPNLLILIVLNACRMKAEMSKNDKVMLVTALLYVATQNLFYGIMVLTRLSEYFFIGYIWLSIKVAQLSGLEKNRRLYMMLLIAYGIVLTVVTIFLRGGNGVIPYKTILQ